MATNANPAPQEKVSVSAKLAAAIVQCVTADVQRDIAIDNYRNVAKAETVRLALQDRKALTAILFASGDQDARRVSEIVGFVFPASDSARKELDKAMEKNAKQEDPKKRIAKQVILNLQRDKTGKLTLEKAIADFKADKTRTPGGATDQVEKKKTKKQTPAEIEEELTALIRAALDFAKANEYDIDDFGAIVESQGEEVFAEEEEEEEEEED